MIPSYLSVLHDKDSVDRAPLPSRCVAKTSFLLAILLSICPSIMNYEVSSVKPRKF